MKFPIYPAFIEPIFLYLECKLNLTSGNRTKDSIVTIIKTLSLQFVLLNRQDFSLATKLSPFFL